MNEINIKTEISSNKDAEDHTCFIARLESLHNMLNKGSSLDDERCIFEIERVIDMTPKYDIGDNGIGIIYNIIKFLIRQQHYEFVNLGFLMMKTCFQHHYEIIQTYQLSFFNLLKNCKGYIKQRQHCLEILTKGGKNVEPFVNEIGSILIDLLQTSHVSREVLHFILNIVRKGNFVLETESLKLMISIICQRYDHVWVEGDTENCKRLLKFFNVVVNYGYENAFCSVHCLRTLCSMVNDDGQITWSIMKHLLMSNCRYQILDCLLQLMNSPGDNSQGVLRGAVFFIGMSCWGSQRVKALHIDWGVILYYMLMVLRCNKGVVVFEVILSIQRLIKKYGEILRLEWETILEIFSQLRPWLSLNDSEAADSKNSGDTQMSIHETRIPRELMDALSIIENLYREEKFNGDKHQYFSVLDLYLPYLSDPSILLLLKFHAEDTHPAHNVEWLSNLTYVMENFFAQTSMPSSVREETLNVLQMTLWWCKHVCEDRVIDEVLLPYLSEVYDDENADVRRRGLHLITEVSRQIETSRFDPLLEVLGKAIDKSIHPESRVIALSGVVSLFSSAFDHLPYLRALKMYEMISKAVEEHRDSEIRRVALLCLLLTCKANKQYQLQWSDTQLRTSRFLFCAPSKLKPDRIKLLVPVERALTAMLTVVSTETRSEVFRMAVKGIQTMLENRFILANVDMSDITMKLVSCLQCKAFGRAALADELPYINSTDKEKGIENSKSGHPLSNGNQNETKTLESRKMRSRCVSESDILKVFGYNNETCANSVVKMRYWIMGYRLVLLLSSYACRFTTNARYQIIKCFNSALKMKPIVGDGVHVDKHNDWRRYVEKPSKRSGSLNRTASAVFNHEKDFFSIHNTETSRSQWFASNVLSRLQNNSQKSSSHRSSLSDANTGDKEMSSASSDLLLKYEKDLFVEEMEFKRIVFRGISLLAMSVPVEFSTLLSNVLESFKHSYTASDGGMRRDIFCMAMETILVLLLVDKIKFGLSGYKEVVGMVVRGLHPTIPCKRTRILSYKALTQCFSRCNIDDRIALVSYALPVLKQNSKDHNCLLSEAAIDFVLRLTYAPAEVMSKSFHEDKAMKASPGMKSKNWIHGNSLITVTTTVNGYAELCVRRATSSTRWLFQIQNHLWYDHLHPMLRLRPPDIRPELVYESTCKSIISTMDKAFITTNNNDSTSTKIASDDEKSVSISEIDSNSSVFQEESNGSACFIDSIDVSHKSCSAPSTPLPGNISSSALNIDTNVNTRIPAPTFDRNTTEGILQSIPSSLRKHRRLSDSDSTQDQCSMSIFDSKIQMTTTKESLQPLPSYDGDGGSPSFFVEQRMYGAVDSKQKPRKIREQLLRASVSNQSLRTVTSLRMNEKNETNILDSQVKSNTSDTCTENENKSVKSNDIPLKFTDISQDEKDKKRNISSEEKNSGDIDSSSNQNEEALDPAFFMTQIHNMMGDENVPQILKCGESLERAKGVLDRTPGMDTHKIGVLYVGRWSQTEDDILCNIGGPPHYMEFILSLGEVLKLKDLTGYTGGLDIRNDTDGKYCLVWRDDCTQAVFHVATMMESVSLENPPSSQQSTAHKITKKKRHIGNDFVHIVYVETDISYNTNTISGQFNDVHIIVQRLHDSDFIVKVNAKDGIPHFGPLYGVQSVPGHIVADMVRLTAFNANIACRIYHEEKLEFVFNSEDRLRQIKQLKNRLATQDALVF